MRDALHCHSTSGSPGMMGWVVGLIWFGIMTIGPISYWGLEPLLLQPPAFLAMLTAIAAFPALGWTMCAGAWRSAWTAQRQIEVLQARFDSLQASIDALSTKLDAADALPTLAPAMADALPPSEQAPAPQHVSPSVTPRQARRPTAPSQAAIRGFESDCAADEARAPAENAAAARLAAAFSSSRVADQSAPEAPPGRSPEKSSENDPLSRAAKRRQRRNRAKQSGAHGLAIPKACEMNPANDLVAAPPIIAARGAVAAPSSQGSKALAPASALWMFWPSHGPHDDVHDSALQSDADPIVDIGRLRIADPSLSRRTPNAIEFAAPAPIAPPIAGPPGSRRPFALKQLRDAQHRAFAR